MLFNARGRQSNRHFGRRRGEEEAGLTRFFSAIIRRLTPLFVIRRALFRVFKRPPRLIKLGVDPTTLLRISELTCPAIASPVSGLERRRVAIGWGVKDGVEVVHPLKVHRGNSRLGRGLDRHCLGILLRENLSDSSNHQ